MAQDQRVEFLFAAQVSGQEQLQKLISSVDSLRKETQQLKTANAGLASSTDSVIRNGTRYNNALDAQSKALRQNRQGTQQLGMQINDFATSVSTGANPVQAFNQQLGQVGFAMSQMGGIAGKVGAFLAGPWGAAIVVATMVLGPLIENLFAVGEESKKTQKAAEDLDGAIEARKSSEENLRLALAKTSTEYRQIRLEMQANALTAMNTAKVELGARLAVLQGLKAEKKEIESNIKAAGGLRAQSEMATGESLRYASVTGAIDDKITGVKAQTAVLERLTAKLNATTIDVVQANDRVNKELGKRTRGSSASADKAKKDKAEFSMLGFYEEFFAKEFQQNDESLARVAENQINSLLSTMPEMAKMSDEMQQIISRNEELNQSFENIGNAVANSFKGMLTGAMSFKDAMKGIIGAVIDELFRLFVVQQIVGIVAGAFRGATGTPGKGFGSSVNLAGRAYGGSVTGKTPYMVGERGPELFVPSGNGTIIPNANMRGTGGGGSSFNISVDARGSNDPAAVRAQVQQGILEAAPAIIAAAESRTIAGLRRPRLGGAMQ